MKLVPKSSPYIRKNVSVKRMMLDVIIALIPVVLFAIFTNGWNGIYVLLISVVTMLVLEWVSIAMMKWPKDLKFKEIFKKEGFAKVKSIYTINNLTAPLISALIYALILPAGCDPYVVFIGAVFGILVGKMLFGGLGSNIFNPAAVGRIFVGICFGTQVGNAYSNVDSFAGATPLAYTHLNLSDIGNYSLADMFLGNIPGCMGEVSAILILVAGVYLLVRRSADFRAMLGYMLTFGVIMLCACVAQYSVDKTSSVLDMWVYQMCGGGLLFGAVYMITDPVTSPTTKFGRLFYAALAGCITALIRVCGAYPEGVAFSILIVNMLAPTIDHFMRGKPNTYTWKQVATLAVVVIIVCAVVTATVLL